MRLSALRASTSPPAMRGVASTSLDTRARQLRAGEPETVRSTAARGGFAWADR